MKKAVILAILLIFQTILFCQTTTPADSLPSDFPEIHIKVNNNPTPGTFYFSNFPLSTGTENVPYLIKMGNDGTIKGYKKLNAPINTDFKLNENGLLTYYDVGKAAFYAMDKNFAIVDSFRAISGWLTDEHELRFLPNGGYMLFGTQAKVIDMSQMIAGGKRNAVVTFCSIQEFDANKNLVFIWKTEDHFDITHSVGIDLTMPYIDYAHCNAIEIDTDGNILLSTRHFDEITKINRTTGNIIWRMGGKECVNNQFTFENDTYLGFFGFSHQHALRKLANGNITLYDNGNMKNPQYSRAVEYSINEQTFIVKKVWEYRNNPDYFGSAMGYVQRLPNNNTVICWGACDSAIITEVTYDKQKVFEMKMGEGILSYRAYKFDDSLSSVNSEITNNCNFELSQNYPNPFNPITTINYNINKAGNVSIIVYNMLGQTVGTLVNGYKNEGSYQVQFNSENISGGLPSGVYLYRMTANNNSQVKKLILLK